MYQSYSIKSITYKYVTSFHVCITLAFQIVKEHVIKTLTFAQELLPEFTLGKNTSYYALI